MHPKPTGFFRDNIVYYIKLAGNERIRKELGRMFESLTKFLPALDMEGLGRWVKEDDTDFTGAPYVEYWDVVHRFCEAAAVFCEETPKIEDPRARELVDDIASAIDREEVCPGVLLGYLENGTIVGWLKELAKLDKK